MSEGKLAKYKQAIQHVEAWFESRNQKPFAFQKRAWRSFLAGNHGLIHSSTGSGKTMAVFLGPVIEYLDKHGIRAEAQFLASHQQSDQGTSQQSDQDSIAGSAPKAKESSPKNASVRRRKRTQSQLRILWVTPLRALAADTEENLSAACRELGLDWHVERRTGDTSSSVRQRQKQAYPEVLVTTPESCCLMLTQPDTVERFSELSLIVVDEWHELLGTKRGVQVELLLARIRSLQPKTRIWGLSATLGDTQLALEMLLGEDGMTESELIRGESKIRLDLRPLLPENPERFPWSGHVGTRQVKQVAEVVRSAESCLVFTNTRSQTEIWYRALLGELPELAGRMATHHGSLDQNLRWWIEDNLRAGKLKCCVCTSSLDLGVDFTQVDHVVQIGSPKSTARLLQRAGRSGHAPGKRSQLTFVPTNSMEVMEYVGLKDGIVNNQMESRHLLRQPLDVLVQHCVTVAIGGGFVAAELLDEVRRTKTFRDLDREAWQWVLDFIERGGASLHAYPDFHRVQVVDGRHVVTDRRIALMHRMSIGTIVSDASMIVQYMSGGKIGTVEESFISRMKVGDTFMLAGKILKLVQVHNNTAYVRKTTGAINAVPRWLGGRLPLSSQLSQAIRSRMHEASQGQLSTAEMRWMEPIFQTQEQISAIPQLDELLIETWRNRDGYHLFCYPFEGRMVHEGLSALVALRLSKFGPVTFSITMNDYGFLLLCKDFAGWTTEHFHRVFTLDGLEQDILSTLNATEMAKRQFKEVARIAGLVFQGYPGQRKQSRHVQASSNMFYEVFEQYDPENLLLKQTKKEVLDLQLQFDRLQAALQRILVSRPLVQALDRPSPFGFGLIVDRLRERVSSETLEARVQRMLEDYDKPHRNRKANSR